MPHNALSCCRCDKELTNVFEDADNQPSKGLAFSSRGSWGSTAFDPCDGTFLQICICDDCLRELGKQNQVLLGRIRETTERELVNWNG